MFLRFNYITACLRTSFILWYYTFHYRYTTKNKMKYNPFLYWWLTALCFVILIWNKIYFIGIVVWFYYNSSCIFILENSKSVGKSQDEFFKKRIYNTIIQWHFLYAFIQCLCIANLKNKVVYCNTVSFMSSSFRLFQYALIIQF